MNTEMMECQASEISKESSKKKETSKKTPRKSSLHDAKKNDASGVAKKVSKKKDTMEPGALEVLTKALGKKRKETETQTMPPSESQRTNMWDIHKPFQLKNTRSTKFMENSENDDCGQQSNNQHSVENDEKSLEIEGEEYILLENDDYEKQCKNQYILDNVEKSLEMEIEEEGDSIPENDDCGKHCNNQYILDNVEKSLEMEIEGKGDSIPGKYKNKGINEGNEHEIS